MIAPVLGNFSAPSQARQNSDSLLSCGCSIIPRMVQSTLITMNMNMPTLTISDVSAVLHEIFEDLGEDLDLGTVDLTAETRLLDLGLESISLLYLVSELQQHYALGDRLFRRMREAGALIRDLSVGELQSMVVALKNDIAA